MTNFIIYTPIYNSNNGGAIVLHKLASMLRSMGQNAKIWPQPKPLFSELKSSQGWLKFLKWFKLVLLNALKIKNIRSPYELPLASQRDIKHSVIIYPEIVSGNPLNAKRVVRWFLNKPGAISGEVNFGEDEIYFYYHEHFNDWEINPNKEHHLNLLEFMSGTYINNNDGEREGQCYMVRKGRDQPYTYHQECALKVDGLSHEEVAKIFNKCKYFISYDLYTMYSRYAAMCGCIPIVVPKDGLTKEQWRPEVFNRYGIAYGWDDVLWALESREELHKFLADSEGRGYESVKNFLTIVEKHFSNTPVGQS